MTVESDGLPVLQNSVSDGLLKAIEGLVHNKYLLDKAVREDGGHCFAGDLCDDAYGPHEGTSFYRLVFPFAPVWSAKGERFSALVPTSQTLGCSWKWRGRNLTPDERKTRLSVLTDPARGGTEGYDMARADYMWIRPLGLVLPHEGKNRVDFLREHQVEMIPARVSEHDYPAASRMVLYSLQVHGKPEMWAVLDGQLVERVNHPSWAAPVLKAYGVPLVQQWPAEYPSADDVVEGFNHPAGNPHFLSEDIVDLEQIGLERARQQEIVICSHLDFRSIQLRSKSFFWYWLAALSISLICLFCLPYTWLVGLGSVAGFAFGTAFGAGLLYFLPLFQARRETLSSDQMEATVK